MREFTIMSKWLNLSPEIDVTVRLWTLPSIFKFRQLLIQEQVSRPISCEEQYIIITRLEYAYRYPCLKNITTFPITNVANKFWQVRNHQIAISSVCLFVCLSVDNIKEKCVKGFSWNFQDRSGLIQGTIWKTWKVSRLTPWVTGFLFLCFQGNFWLSAK